MDPSTNAGPQMYPMYLNVQQLPCYGLQHSLLNPKTYIKPRYSLNPKTYTKLTHVHKTPGPGQHQYFPTWDSQFQNWIGSSEKDPTTDIDHN